MSFHVEGFGLGCVVKRDCRLAKDSYLNHPDHYDWSGYRYFLRDRHMDCEEFDLHTCVHVTANCICISSPKTKPLLIPELPKPRVCFCSGPYRCLKGTLRSTGYMLFRQVYDDYINRTDSEQYGMEFTLSELANAIGFSTMDDVIRDVLPCIPEEIRLLAEYLDLFDDEQTGSRFLRPMVLEY
jgi:hypothetical protein